MADAPTEDDKFAQDLADAFAADEAAENPVTPAAAEVLQKPGDPTLPAPIAPKVEEPKKDEPVAPEDPNKKEEPATPPGDPAKKPEEGAQPPETPKTPGEPVAPQPLTKDDVNEIITKIRNDERVTGQDLKVATDEVMEAYYPDGLSNVLVDQSSGKELRTPQDVVDASGGDMSMEQAAQWLMNEQYKLDQNIAKIKNDAQGIAETTVKFKNDSVAVLQRYDSLFKAYPQVQTKIWNQYSKLIKADQTKGVILSAPDMAEFYDTMLEPYRLAFEYSQNLPSTNPTPVAPVTPPATPGINDRMDEGGDGGLSPVDDPNDFAQQVNKELAKGI